MINVNMLLFNESFTNIQCIFHDSSMHVHWISNQHPMEDQWIPISIDLPLNIHWTSNQYALDGHGTCYFS